MEKDFIFYIITIILILVICEFTRSFKIYQKAIKDLAGITATYTIFNVKFPGTNNIIDMVTIHPTGIYLINKIQYEGHIKGTLMTDFWEIDTIYGTTSCIKNPIIEMRENESKARRMFYEPLYTVIVFKNNTNCPVLENWINNDLIIVKEYEQEEIFKNKKYVIPYNRANEIGENMKQFQSKKRRS